MAQPFATFSDRAHIDLNHAPQVLYESNKLIPFLLIAQVCTGDQLTSLTDKRIDQILQHNQIVFARTSPAQKLQIVQVTQTKITNRWRTVLIFCLRFCVLFWGFLGFSFSLGFCFEPGSSRLSRPGNRK